MSALHVHARRHTISSMSFSPQQNNPELCLLYMPKNACYFSIANDDDNLSQIFQSLYIKSWNKDNAKRCIKYKCICIAAGTTTAAAAAMRKVME